jgi:hypothetical protein
LLQTMAKTLFSAFALNCSQLLDELKLNKGTLVSKLKIEWILRVSNVDSSGTSS